MDEGILQLSDKHLVHEDLSLQHAKARGLNHQRKKPTKQYGLTAFQAHIYYL